MPLIQELDHWLDSEYAPDEEVFFRLGQQIIISKPTSTAMECLELEFFDGTFSDGYYGGATMEIISFDGNGKSKKCLSAFDRVSAIIFCVPISDYDCFINSSGSKFTVTSNSKA